MRSCGTWDGRLTDEAYRMTKHAALGVAAVTARCPVIMCGLLVTVHEPARICQAAMVHEKYTSLESRALQGVQVAGAH